ncbi:Spo0E family sporulation regulatory protein-aspartic acid phosphatase [Halanaerobacter jeridensis]|uniref:Spo0E like sporulation regulatory protein n=1 Tax=Halanaerobacter jeridensis TaxID=706427 RepID=A0A938XV10_9FIRM|nr:Spo0E family sporulation regulatory protein-aspartic acid phosphatase [Halanaerobacter jeridensis]MBM7556841.1 hypothetical protein [Halanaerobacter jeridensis]
MKLKVIELERDDLEEIYKKEDKNLKSSKLLDQSQKLDKLIVKSLREQLKHKLDK